MAVGKLSWTDPRSRTSRRGRFRTRVTRSAHNRTRPRIAGPATAYRDALSSISFSLFSFSPPPSPPPPPPLTEFTPGPLPRHLSSRNRFIAYYARHSRIAENVISDQRRESLIRFPRHWTFFPPPSHSSRIYIHKFSPSGFVTDGNG